jgi:hypothetical protein
MFPETADRVLKILSVPEFNRPMESHSDARINIVM